MGDKTRLSLQNIGTVLGILMVLVTVVGACSITYDDAKEANRKADQLEIRIQAIETSQARFEGKIEERTRITLDTVNQILAKLEGWDAN